MNALLIRLLNRDYSISWEIPELRDYLAGHFANAVLYEPRVLVCFHHHVTLVPPLEKFVDARTHGILQDLDDLLEADMLIVICLNAEEAPTALVVRGHRHLLEECLDLFLLHAKVLEDMQGMMF